MAIAASPGQLVIEPEQQFIITNNGDEPLSLTWASRTYVIEPGDHKVVPFDIVRLYFGDPRSVRGVEQKYDDPREIGGHKNPNPYIARREKEVERLSVLYGLYHGNEAKLVDHPKIKDVVITTLDRTEIFCPAIDPEGTAGLYGHREATDNVQDTASMLALMERRLAQQQAMIDELRGVVASNPPEDEDDVGIDRPRFPE